MFEYKDNMSKAELTDFEQEITNRYQESKSETSDDLSFRVGGVAATRGSSGYQFVGYNTLQQFYRGDQWNHNEAPGASQRTDNYCATIVENFASLLFDAPVEVNIPSLDETDDVLEMKAEIKEKMIMKVYDDNDADDIVFPQASKCGSLYGDTFIKGPLLDKKGSKKKEDWKIVFLSVENPANIRPLFMDQNYRELYGFIDTTAISPTKAIEKYGDLMKDRGISQESLVKKATERTRMQKLLDSANAQATKGILSQPNIGGQQSFQKMIMQSEMWTDKYCAIFLEDGLIDWYWHDWGFVPLQYVKNIYVPNYPYGKSDIEDIIDPQLFQTRVNNDLANAIKFLSTINMKGKNLDGMEVLIHGLSKIFNMPEDGELDPIQRSGDPYAAGNFVESRRRAILDISGLSEAMTASGGANLTSGRALSMAMQSVIRKLNPKIKRYQAALKGLNSNILRLIEKYWPETKEIIMGDYTNEVSIISTLLRNIIDELNKLQSGVQSLSTTQKNIGIPQPKIEQKKMKKDLGDPMLGPQIARQPGLLQVQSPESMAPSMGSDGNQLPQVPNQASTPASAEGAIAAGNQRAGGGAPVPVNPITP